MPRVSISTRHAPIRAVAARAAASSAAQVCASWSGLCCHSGVVDASVLVMRPAYRRMRTYDLGYSGVDQPRGVTEAGPAHDSAILVGDHHECPQWIKLGCLCCGPGVWRAPSTKTDRIVCRSMINLSLQQGPSSLRCEAPMASAPMSARALAALVAESVLPCVDRRCIGTA